MVPKENSLKKKNYRSEFLYSSFIFVICLLKEVYTKIMSEIHFVGKTRYEDHGETGWKNPAELKLVSNQSLCSHPKLQRSEGEEASSRKFPS